MTIWFTIKEGLKGFKRARLATTITISSIAFALLLIGYFLVFSVNVNSLIGEVRSKIELEVFLEPELDESMGFKIKEKINSIAGVKSVEYISKAEAAFRFEREFGRNIFDILDSNPLPATCVVKLEEGFRSAIAVRRLSIQIEQLQGVDEVIYQSDFLAVIDRYIDLIYILAGGIGSLLAVIAVVLLYNTIRLTISARRDIIEIMQLVGATSAFIRRPFVVEGFVQGLIGALLANGLIFLSLQIVSRWIYPFVVSNPFIYLFIIIFGALIGFFSSRLSVSKYLP